MDFPPRKVYVYKPATKPEIDPGSAPVEWSYGVPPRPKSASRSYSAINPSAYQTGSRKLDSYANIVHCDRQALLCAEKQLSSKKQCGLRRAETRSGGDQPTSSSRCHQPIVPWNLRVCPVHTTRHMKFGIQMSPPLLWSINVTPATGSSLHDTPYQDLLLRTDTPGISIYMEGPTVTCLGFSGH